MEELFAMYRSGVSAEFPALQSTGNVYSLRCFHSTPLIPNCNKGDQLSQYPSTNPIQPAATCFSS